MDNKPMMGQEFKQVHKPDIAYTLSLIDMLHEGQVDQSGKPYSEHPKRVAANVLGFKPDADDDIIMAALLHDTIEDCKIDASYLRQQGYSKACVEMVMLLTKPDDDTRSYHQVIDDLIASGNHGAMLIKLADNADNLHPDRVQALAIRNPEKAERLQSRYYDSVARLSSALDLSREYVLEKIREQQPADIRPELVKEI